MTDQAIGDQWYFYADTRIDYFCRLNPEIKIPARFHGPHESQAAARKAWLEWSLEKMEQERDEYEYQPE